MWIGEHLVLIIQTAPDFPIKKLTKALADACEMEGWIFLTIQKDRNHHGNTGRVNSRPVLPHSIGYYCRIGQCIGQRKNAENLSKLFHGK